MVGVSNEVSKYRITINTILPELFGLNDKAINRNRCKSKVSAKQMIAIKSKSVPTNTIGEPNDVGYLVTYLCSDYDLYKWAIYSC